MPHGNATEQKCQENHCEQQHQKRKSEVNATFYCYHRREGKVDQQDEECEGNSHQQRYLRKETLSKNFCFEFTYWNSITKAQMFNDVDQVVVKNSESLKVVRYLQNRFGLV